MSIHILIPLILINTFTLNSNGVSFKSPNFENDTKDLKKSLENISSSNERYFSFGRKTLMEIDSKLSKLEEKSQVWSTYQHYITAWIDQMASMDRKLDILNKGQEHILDISNKLNNLETYLREKEIHLAKTERQLQQILNYLLQIEGEIRNKRGKFFDLVGDYTARGILSTVERIENKLEAKCFSSPTEEVAAESGTENQAETSTLSEESAQIEQSEETENLLCNDFSPVDFLTDCHYLNGSFWTVILRRGPYKKQVNFNETWENYREGFGNKRGEFWSGNELLHLVTRKNNPLTLRIELEDFNGNTAWAQYENFTVASEEENYRLGLGTYSGNATDSFGSHNGTFFSTFDENHDEAPFCCPCATSYGSGWWYNVCFDVNLNGIYHGNPTENEYYGGIIWDGWLGNYSLKKARMMIKESQ